MAHPISSNPVQSGATWVDQHSEWLIVGGIIGASLLVFTLNLGGVALRDWDEGLVAQVAREMTQALPGSQGWFYPTLWGEPYFNKPPLVHTLVAIAYRVGGVNEWTARLPGAWLTAASVPLLYGVARELFIRRLPALLGTGVYLTTLPIVRHGRLAMLDGAVLCFFLLLLGCLLRSRRDPRWSLGVGIGLSGLLLSKGIVGILLGAIALSFVIWDAPRLLTSIYHWMGLFIGILPAIAWYGLQSIEYGHAFWAVHLFSQSLDRVTESVESNNGPPWYYLLEILKYGWPWLVFVPVGLQKLWGDRRRSWAKLILVWLVGYLGVISIMSTKLPWYVLPIYPALALVVGHELARLWDDLSGLSPKLTPSVSYRRSLIGFFTLLALVGWGGVVYFGGVEKEGYLALMLAALGLTMTVTTGLLIRRDRQFIPVLIWGFYITLLLFVSSGEWGWELGEDYPVKPVAALIRSSVPANEEVFTSHPLNRPSLNFYAEHRVLPATQKQLRQRWRRDAAPYLLLDEPTLKKLNFTDAQLLGDAEGWVLIGR